MVSVSMNETVLMQWLQSLSQFSQQSPLFDWSLSVDVVSCDMFMSLQWSLIVALSLVVSIAGMANAALSGSRAREVISSRTRNCFVVFCMLFIN